MIRGFVDKNLQEQQRKRHFYVMSKYFRCFSLLLLLELCSQCTAESSSCGYKKGSDGLHYKFHHKNVDWETAKETCEEEDAHLAIISSSATFEYVKNAYTFHMSGIWIGARDMNSKNDWRWLDQTPVQKSYWQIGEPNNYQGKQEDCAMINFVHGPGRLHDAPCDWTGPKFLCQKEQQRCVKEEGYCVANGRDVDTTKLANVPADECLEKCLSFQNATGCSVVEEHESKGGYGCYITSEYVTEGNGDEKHACWIISKCKGKGSLVPPPQRKSTSCKPYHCHKNSAQMGYDISYGKANTLDECSQHCCRMSQCINCIGFDWVPGSRDCWLSKTPRSRVPTSKAQGVYSCEFKDIRAGYKKGYGGSFFKLYSQEVDWYTAKLKCSDDGGKLVQDDSIGKHYYLIQTYQKKTYWIGNRNLKHNKYDDNAVKRLGTSFWDSGQPAGNGMCAVMWHNGRWHDALCSASRSFVCEINGVTVTSRDEHNYGALALFVLLGLGGVLIFISVRAFIFLRNRAQRRSGSEPSPDQGISNEAMSQDVVETAITPIPYSANVQGITVIPPPPQYNEIFPPDNGFSVELPPPPPPSYVGPANCSSGYNRLTSD